MRFDIKKLEYLKNQTANLYREQKKTDAISQKLGSVDTRDISPKRYQSMNQNLICNLKYLEKVAVGISKVVAELGFNDIDPERSYHNGWCEHK